MSEPIISVSGLRGIVGESLTPEVAMRYACAFASRLAPGAILLSRDGRASGPMLMAAITAALEATGRDVLMADVAATPTTGILVREYRAAGGIQISASHNPAPYNGMKLFGGDGRILSASIGAEVVERYRAGKCDWVKHDQLGRRHPCPDTVSTHVALVEQLVDLERIRKRHFRVLLDANHGAGALVGQALLERLGCELTVLGGEPDGQFAHPPEPTAENLAGVLARVVALRADVGFCQDPDADRLAVIDERGRYLGEEYTLALCADHVLASRPGAIVTNCSTSRMAEDLAQKHGVPFFRSAVGEANVVDRMLEHQAVLGGEGNGGVIEPRVGLVRDSFVGMALVLDAMAKRGQPLSQIADALPRYEIVKTKMTLPHDKLHAALAAVERRFADARRDTLDGLRLDWSDKWLLVRASNTEPIVRAIAEAPTAAEAQRLCDEAQRAMASA